MRQPTLSIHQQKGAVAIEFSIIFILLFILFFGIVSFVMPFLLKNNYEDMASNILTEAIATPSSELGSMTADNREKLEKEIEQRAKQSINQSSLPDNWKKTCEGYEGKYVKIKDRIWSACVANPNADKLMPSIKIPLPKDEDGNHQWINIPDLPKELRGEATILR